MIIFSGSCDVWFYGLNGDHGAIQHPKLALDWSRRVVFPSVFGCVSSFPMGFEWWLTHGSGKGSSHWDLTLNPTCHVQSRLPRIMQQLHELVFLKKSSIIVLSIHSEHLKELEFSQVPMEICVWPRHRDEDRHVHCGQNSLRNAVVSDGMGGYTLQKSDMSGWSLPLKRH